MSVVSVMTFTAAPGKNLVAQAYLKEVLETVTGLGARGVVTLLVRGGVPGTMNVVTDHDDPVAFAATLERTYNDPGMRELMAKGQALQALVPVRSIDYIELPGLETPYSAIAGHTAIRATLFTIHHGKRELSLGRFKRSKELTEKHGAKMRCLQSLDSDPFGVCAAVTYYPNVTESGKITASLAADPAWQDFLADIFGENASGDFLRTTFMRVI